MVTAFLLVYFVCVLMVFLRNKPVLTREMINFATQYATVQKRLLNNFEVPYALLDVNGRILWLNKKFAKVTGKGKEYHKSIFSIFPSITKEQLMKEENEASFQVVWEDKIFRAETNRIYFESMTEESNIVEAEEKEQYLLALYLFDETELNHYIKENEDQKLVAALVYIDNYEEALDSIEDVKRSLLVALDNL